MPTIALAPPNGELVAQAWVSAYTPLDPGQIATTLGPIGSWVNDGFLTVRALSAGNPNTDLIQRRSTIVQLDTWAAKAKKDPRNGNPLPESTPNPLWGVAAVMMERIRIATMQGVQVYGRPLQMARSGYTAARVFAAYLTREPTRVEGDPSGYARFTCDMAIDWTV